MGKGNKGGAGAVIGFAIGAATSFIGGGPVATATWLIAGLKGASIGYSIGAVSPSYSSETVNVVAENTPIPVIYGKHRVGGNVIYERLSKRSKELHLCVAVGEGEINSHILGESIRINDTPLIEVHSWSKPISYRSYLGTADQEAFEKVLTRERFPYTAYLAFTFPIGDKINSVPTVGCVVEGRKVRVWKPETGTWVTEWSNNPAWCLLDYLTNKRYGLGKDDGIIDLESFKESAEYCDELVDGEKRFELDVVLDVEKSSLDILQALMMTFRANLIFSDGQLRLKIEKSEDPTQAFNMDNIVDGTFSYQLSSWKEIPNQVVVEFADRENDWQTTAMVYDNEIAQMEKEEVYSLSVPLFGITRASQAGRMARYYHNLSKRCDTFCEFTAGIDSIHCEVGDIVAVSHDTTGWDKKLFMVIEMGETEDDLMTLRCRAYDSAIYHDKGSNYQHTEQTALPSPYEPPLSVTNLALVEEYQQLADGTWIPQIKVSWDTPEDAFWRQGNIWLSSDGGLSWEFVKAIEGTATKLNVGENGQYLVKIVSENHRSIKEDFRDATQGAITIYGKKTAPSNVVWDTCLFTTDISLTWNAVSDSDISGYEVRAEDDNWGVANSCLIYKGAGLSYSFTPKQRDYTFYVKAFDRQGNYSEKAASVNTSIPSPQKPIPPTVEPFFEMLKVKLPQVSSNSVLGHKIYIWLDGETEKKTFDVPKTTSELSYPEGIRKRFWIQIAEYDIVGEGEKSTPQSVEPLPLQENNLDEGLTEKINMPLVEVPKLHERMLQRAIVLRGVLYRFSNESLQGSDGNFAKDLKNFD